MKPRFIKLKPNYQEPAGSKKSNSSSAHRKKDNWVNCQHRNVHKPEALLDILVCADEREDSVPVVSGDFELAAAHRPQRHRPSFVGAVDERGVQEGCVGILNIRTLKAARTPGRRQTGR